VIKKAVAALFLLLALFAIPALADQVVLKNGDRITGSIEKSDGKTLVIKTDYAGEITLKYDVIQSMTSTADLHVTLGGKTAVGPVTTSDGNLVVASKTAGNVEAPLASVTVLRDPAQQAAWEKLQHPGLLEGWQGGLNLGLAATTGNSETKNLNVAFNAARKGLHDKLTLYENTIYAVTDKPTSLTTANTDAGGIRYDRDFAPRVFGFGSADFFANALQDLSLRSILSGGLGWHAIKNPNTTLDLLAGLSFTHEKFSDVPDPDGPAGSTYSPSDSSASLTLGDAFMHKLGKTTVLTQSFLIYPGLTTTPVIVVQPAPPNTTEDIHVYRFMFNLGTVTKINKWLGWQNTVSDVFVSNPPTVPEGTARIERNDVQISTGLNFSFTH
jgi:putative salt-induced outer membrane protein YdiY